MNRCIIKANTITLYNSVSFVEVDKDNNVKFGYLMFDNDISYSSREYICDFITFNSRILALAFAFNYNNQCYKLKDNFYKLEDYIFEQSRIMRDVPQALTA